MLKFIDLFSGIGGFRLALENKGLKCVYSCEIHKQTAKAYEQNFGDDPLRDIRNVNESDVPAHDVLCAGFPCQSFSCGGKKEGFSDKRGKLFFDIVRIVQYRKPLIIILENVRHLLNISNGEVFNAIRKSFENIGYTFHYSLLDCSNFGIPQSRKRVYIVCIRKEARLNYQPPKPHSKTIYLKDILLRNDQCRHLISKQKDLILYCDTIHKWATEPVRIGHFGRNITASDTSRDKRVYSPHGHAVTLVASGEKTGLYFVSGIVRKLHINECTKLMGFPTKHILSQGEMGYTQLGNAVCVPMIKHVYDGIKKTA